jgi:hypothetical protein
MMKGKIRPRKSPNGAPLFFVKDVDKPLRGAVENRALNRRKIGITHHYQDLMRCLVDLEKQEYFRS